MPVIIVVVSFRPELLQNNKQAPPVWMIVQGVLPFLIRLSNQQASASRKKQKSIPGLPSDPPLKV